MAIDIFNKVGRNINLSTRQDSEGNEIEVIIKSLLFIVY